MAAKVSYKEDMHKRSDNRGDRRCHTNRTDKAPKTNGIIAEPWKYRGRRLLKCLYELVTAIWGKKIMSADWSTSFICPVYKKSNRQVYNNHRWFILLNVALLYWSRK